MRDANPHLLLADGSESQLAAGPEAFSFLGSYQNIGSIICFTRMLGVHPNPKAQVAPEQGRLTNRASGVTDSMSSHPRLHELAAQGGQASFPSPARGSGESRPSGLGAKFAGGQRSFSRSPPPSAWRRAQVEPLVKASTRYKLREFTRTRWSQIPKL